ncbi:UNVERIFIED_CONTAM: hypothetical protein Sangu_2644700 [Sesamum angustifolium]|uniref:Uncharacterized protein n=1 Tax=Sesamum angustifolium TaxID=2727405 RepID=A0AAW2J2I1_9LAMI
MEDHQHQRTADEGHIPGESEASVMMTEQQMWLATIGGNNKGCVFRLGSEAHFSSQTYTSLSPPLPTPLQPPPPQNPNVEDRIARLDEMMDDMMAIMREMEASSSTFGPSQPTTSSTSIVQPPQPPTDP